MPVARIRSCWEYAYNRRGAIHTVAITVGNSLTFMLVNLAPSGRTLLTSVPDASPTASSHPQFCQRELCQCLCPIPVRSSAWGASSTRTIPPALDRLQLVIDHAVARMPHLPEHHLPAAPHTP